MSDVPSFQDLLGEFSDEVFVGRGEQLTIFEQLFKATRPPFLILGVSGQGGVGKSTLLHQYRHIAESHHTYSAIVNEDHVAVPTILAQFSKQLEDQGVSFKEFNERYHKYRELREQVEADPKAPSGILDFAMRGVMKVGLRSLKRIPVIGEIKDVFITSETEDLLAEQGSAFVRYIAQKFNDKDDKLLIFETDSELSKYFLSDLNKITTSNKVILFFDTYEKTASSIEEWLIDLIHGDFGSFSGNTLFAIAGRYSLGQSWMEYKKAVKQIELHEFTEDEAREYLTRSGISDEKQILQIIEISNRLPILLALLASSPSNLPEDVSGDAIERFLQGRSQEHREAALVASLPRYFNEDVLSAILGKDEGANAFNWLSQEHFVRSSEHGWVYHDVVRSLMLRYLHSKSREKFVDTHQKLNEYYLNLANELKLSKEKQHRSNEWRRYKLECLYHFCSINPSQHMIHVAKIYISGMRELLEGFFRNEDPDNDISNGIEVFIEACSSILTQITEEVSEPALKIFAEQYKKLVTFFDTNDTEQGQNGREIFMWLANVDGLEDQEKSIAYILLAVSISVVSDNEAGNKECLIFVNKAIHLSPDTPILYALGGMALNWVKEYPASLVNSTKAIELQLENGTNYYWRGITYYQLHDYPSALADFTRAIELQPEDGNNYFWRGTTYYQQQEYPSALTDLTKAIELQPENGNNYNWRGRTHYELEEYPSALTDFTKAIELHSEDGYNYNWRGRTHYELEEYPSALTDFTKAVELQPEDGNNYHGRGITYYQLHDYRSALTDLTKAIELQPKDGYNYLWRGMTYYRQQEYPSALTDFTKAIELQPEDVYNYLWRGMTYYELEEYPSALTDFTKAIELQSENGYNYHWRGRTYYQRREYPSALTDLTKAIELQPENGNNYRWRGRTHYELEEYSSALTDFTKAIELQLENGTNYYWRGITYYQLHDYSSALTDFTRAIELQPEDGINYYWRGRINLKIKEFRAAFADFSKSTDLEADDDLNFYMRGLSQKALGNNKAFEKDIQTAIQLFHSKLGGEATELRNELILALYTLAYGENENAKALYQRVIDECTERDALKSGISRLEDFIELNPNHQYAISILGTLNNALNNL